MLSSRTVLSLARFWTLDSDNIVLMPAGLRWSLDWDCCVKSSCCGVNTLSTSFNPAYMKFSSLATWYSIIHAAFKSESSNVSLLTSSPANSDGQILIHWHLSQYGDIEVVQVWSHMSCSGSSTTLTSIKTDDAIYSRTLMLSLYRWSSLCGNGSMAHYRRTFSAVYS